jgi:hypothetical protein
MRVMLLDCAKTVPESEEAQDTDSRSLERLEPSQSLITLKSDPQNKVLQSTDITIMDRPIDRCVL